MLNGEPLRTEDSETYWVREKLDEVYLKESNRVKQQDYINCCFEPRAG